MKKVDRAAIYAAATALSNWGRWGSDDQIGTLNNVSREDVIGAAKLIRKGTVFALGLSLKEPIQSGLEIWNPEARSRSELNGFAHHADPVGLAP